MSSVPVSELLPHASQRNISDTTPMGANLVEGGATFRVWAPEALEVYVVTDELPIARRPGWRPRQSSGLLKRQDGSWGGFMPGLADGSRYRFYVVGRGSSGFKRDPWARELGTDPPYPD